jgi:hypothetical protein
MSNVLSLQALVPPLEESCVCVSLISSTVA